MRVLKALVVIVLWWGWRWGSLCTAVWTRAETFVDILPGTGTLGIARRVAEDGDCAERAGV